MNNQTQVQTVNNQIAQNFNVDAIETFRIAMQNFLKAQLNKEPDPNGIDKTPDGKAQTLVISHVEMTLDELYFGEWETENFKWSVIANEVVGSIDLIVTHPVSRQKIRRVGSASIQIMVDKAPENVNKNQWALNPENKKPNALDTGAGRLKTECLKNAAKSLGKVFGRDLNRKIKDDFQPMIKPNRQDKEKERMMHLIDDCETMEQMDLLFGSVPNDLADYFNKKMNLLKEKIA